MWWAALSYRKRWRRKKRKEEEKLLTAAAEILVNDTSRDSFPKVDRAHPAPAVVDPAPSYQRQWPRAA